MLSSLEDWALLRNEDVIGNFLKGGDCDLIVENTSSSLSKIIRKLGPPSYVTKRFYVTSLDYPWGHIDLANHFYWKGFKLCDGKYMLSHARSNQQWPLISNEHQAITMLLNSLLWGGFVKNRYKQFIYETFASNMEAVSKSLQSMIGQSASYLVLERVAGQDWSGLESYVGKIRFKVGLNSLAHDPVGSIYGNIHYVYRELHLRARPPLPVVLLHKHTSLPFTKVSDSLKQESTEHGYQIKVVNGNGRHRHTTLLQSLLKYRSFRAKKGLVVLVVDMDFNAGPLSRYFYRDHFNTSDGNGFISRLLKHLCNNDSLGQQWT